MGTIPESITALYKQPGPFVTVYFDATRSTESGAHEVELRWQELRSGLQQQGAAEPDLVAVDEAIAEHLEVGGRHGQVIVAAEGGVVFDAVLPAPPARPRAVVGPLPDLVPFLVQSDPRVGYVLVIADHAGADLVGVPAELAALGVRPAATSVDGSSPYPLHKTRRDEWDERKFQNRVDNSWAANARDVAVEVGHQASTVGAELIVLAGDPRARSLLRADLSSVLGPHVKVAEVETGSRADGTSPEALDAAVHDALLRHTWTVRREVLEHLQQNLGRERYAVAGAAEVLDALRRAQADTVVLSDDPTSTLTAWIGPEPTEFGLSADELHAMGVEQPQQVRFDAALLRAVAGSGANFVVTPNAHDYVRGGIAALLRYDDAATP